MKIHQVLDQLFVFKKIGDDCLGINYRVGELKGNKPSAHKLVTEIYPYIFNDTKFRSQAISILETVGKLGIPNLYAPERIIQKEDNCYLVYPYIAGKSLDRVLEEAGQKNLTVPFSLAFQLIMAIGNIIKMGTSIHLEGSRFFHGFLTPDNIIVGNNGKLYLKYYGLWPFITQKEDICGKTISKYGSWLAPEFIKREEIVPQADIYYLGYLVYRMLTGKYFAYLPGEDFDTTITNISFASDIPLTDKDFLTNIIEFFRKTLNPDIRKRFSGTEELIKYIENHFKIKDTGLVSPELASFMFSVYKEGIEDAKKELQQELSAPIPERKTDSIGGTFISTTILEEPKNSKLKYVGLIAFVIILIGAGTFYYLNRISAAEQRQVEGMMQKISQLEQHYQLQIENLRNTYEEKFQQDHQNKDAHLAERDKLIREIESQRKREIESIRTQLQDKGVDLKETEKTKIPKNTKKDDASVNQTEKAVTVKKGSDTTAASLKEQKLKDEGKTIPATPVIVALSNVTVKPEKIIEKEPVFTADIARNYQGKRATIQAMLLVNQEGNVEKVKLLNSPKLPKDLENAIVSAFMDWTYTPAQKDKIPVKVWIPETIKFSIDRPSSSEPNRNQKADQTPGSIHTSATEIFTLGEVGTQPIKISGNDPAFSKAIRKTYAGRRATVESELLIDENGNVIDVKTSGNIPDEIKTIIVQNYKTWKYKPALREGKIVKTWLPISYKILFKR